MDEKTINKAISKIISPEEYSKIKHKIPYTYEINNSNNTKSLFFFGVKHSADPNNPMFLDIRSDFEKFKPDFVIVEATPGPKKLSRKEFNLDIKNQPIDELIKRRSDPGFAIRLAVENNVEWFCPEPGSKDEAEYLLEQGYTKEAIQAWSLFRNIPVYNLRRGERTFEEFADKSVQSFLEKTNWKLNNSLVEIITKGQELIGREIDVNNDMGIKKYISPGDENEMQRINKSIWTYRDKIILKNIILKLEGNNRIFIVYGHSHAFVLEPALRYLLSKE